MVRDGGTQRPASTHSAQIFLHLISVVFKMPSLPFHLVLLFCDAGFRGCKRFHLRHRFHLDSLPMSAMPFSSSYVLCVLLHLERILLHLVRILQCLVRILPHLVRHELRAMLYSERTLLHLERR